MNEITIKVRVDNETEVGFAAIEAAAKVAGDHLESSMRNSGEKAGRMAGDEVAGELNRQLRELRLPELDVHANASEARAKLAEIEAQVKALASDDMTIDVKIRTQRALTELNEFRRHFKEVEEEGDDNGKGWGSRFLASAKSKIMDLGGEGLSGAIVPLGAALAPLLGASIAAGVVGGVGLGGIAGGFALAAQDESVQFAMLRLQDNLREKLAAGTEQFAPVAVNALDTISDHLNKINFKGIFADLAPQVGPLVGGVTVFIDKMSAAIEKLVHNAGPVIKVIGDEIGDLGTVLSRGLGLLSDNSKQEAEALKDLFAIVNGGIEIFFELVNVLTEVYDIFHKMEQISLPGIYELLTDKSRKVKDQTVDLAKAVVEHMSAVQGETTSVELATAALTAEDDALHQVAKSLRASTDPLFAFMDAQDSLTAKQKAMNNAIRDHGRNSQQARAATRDYQKALIEYISSAAAASNGTGHLTAEQKRLLASAGASKQRIKELDDAMYAAWRQANKLDGFEIDITVKQRFVQTGKYISDSQIENPVNLYSGLAHGGIKGAASGPISSGLTWVGENGPELMSLPPGTTVRTAGDSARTARQLMGGGGAPGGQPFIVVLELDGERLAMATVDPVRRLVRNQFGGSVQAALGQG